MTIYNFFQDIISILKKEKKLILLVTIIVTLLFTFLRLFYFSQSVDNSDEGFQETEEAAGFNIYIEEELLGVFTNSYLLEMLITDDNIINDIETDSNVEIKETLDMYTDDNDRYYTEEDPINIERNRSSNIMMVTVSLGSSQSNIKVANSLFKWFQDNNHPFFENKSIYIIDEPTELNNETVDLAGSDNALNDNYSRLREPRFILQLFLSLIAGVVLGIIMSILKVLMSEKINYSFSYGWGPEDIFIKLNKYKTDFEFVNALVRSNQKNVLILSEHDLEKSVTRKLEEFSSKDILLSQSLTEVPIDYSPDEITLLIEKNRTNKSWYRSQRQLIKAFKQVDIKIVEI